MLTESGGEPVGRVLTSEEQERLLKAAEDNPEWEHVWCAAQLAANTSMRGVEVKHVRRKDFDAEKRVVHIRASKNETSKRVIPLNDSAFDAVQRMVNAPTSSDTRNRTTICGARASITSWTRRSRRASGIRRGVRYVMRLACLACVSTTSVTPLSPGSSRPASRITWSNRLPGTSRGGCSSTIRTSASTQRRPHSIGSMGRRKAPRSSARSRFTVDQWLHTGKAHNGRVQRREDSAAG